MKLATWNVNSLRVRLPQVLDWLTLAQPDVLALQETKIADAEFPAMEIEAAGYHAVFCGERAYNGVAILSRHAPRDLVPALPGVEPPQQRFLAATVGVTRVVCVYVPNGQALGSPAYDYKLQWLSALRQFVDSELKRHPALVVMGDFNIAPDERDVHDPDLWANSVLFSGPERAAFRALQRLGLVDVVRRAHGDAKLYSWWDYQYGAFRRNRGLRLDHILASEALAARCVGAEVDRTPRGWERPSDHTPVVASFSDPM